MLSKSLECHGTWQLQHTVTRAPTQRGGACAVSNATRTRTGGRGTADSWLRQAHCRRPGAVGVVLQVQQDEAKSRRVWEGAVCVQAFGTGAGKAWLHRRAQACVWTTGPGLHPFPLRAHTTRPFHREKMDDSTALEPRPGVPTPKSGGLDPRSPDIVRGGAGLRLDLRCRFLMNLGVVCRLPPPPPPHTAAPAESLWRQAIGLCGRARYVCGIRPPPTPADDALRRTNGPSLGPRPTDPGPGEAPRPMPTPEGRAPSGGTRVPCPLLGGWMPPPLRTPQHPPPVDFAGVPLHRRCCNHRSLSRRSLGQRREMAGPGFRSGGPSDDHRRFTCGSRPMAGAHWQRTLGITMSTTGLCLGVRLMCRPPLHAMRSATATQRCSPSALPGNALCVLAGRCWTEGGV